MVHATSDSRTVNNVMRHQYRVLSDQEKADMQKLKDMGLELHSFLNEIASRDPGNHSWEITQACSKVEEAVMWGTKYLTR